MNFSRRVVVGVALGVVLLGGGCRKHRKSVSAPNTTDYADNIQAMVGQKQLSVLRWPDYSDYQPAVNTFYDDRNFELAWVRDLKPTAQATAFIQAFNSADTKGLHPEDYDASRWAARVAGLERIRTTKDTSTASQDTVAQFDAAMTVCVMRYISDLRIGRVNPTRFSFDINTAEKKYDLPEFLSDKAVDASDVPALITSVEPNAEQYRATEAALAHYVDLAHGQAAANAPLLPQVARPVSVGGSYAAIPALAQRLQLEGDLASATGSAVYDSALAEGVKSYQHRHGIAEDGKLNAQTISSMNVPLTVRVVQLQDALERWRWLPDEYLNAPLMVNLPEFVLRGYDAQHHVEFTMNVVVGKVVGEHKTPVFAHMMKYLIFRPYWNVPVDIAQKELVPHMRGGSGYLESKNFEVTDSKGNVQTGYTADQVAHGQVLVREKPGPKNSLGLVKFMFPNQYDIYMHSTPAMELMNRSRRDFSHGCIRLQHPDELAAWVLRGEPGDWDISKVQDAMNNGPDNHQVTLKKQIPVVIFYVTGIAAEDGHIHFFDDIYGYDKDLEANLVKGPPYSAKPEPKAKPVAGDTL